MKPPKIPALRPSYLQPKLPPVRAQTLFGEGESYLVCCFKYTIYNIIIEYYRVIEVIFVFIHIYIYIYLRPYLG